MASVLLNNALECAICCETFKSPKVLQCGHTYCLDCIERYISGRTETFPCPLCGQSVRIPEGGAKMLTTNFIVQATTSTSSIQEASNTTSPQEDTCTTSSDVPQVTGTTSSDTEVTGTTSPNTPQGAVTTSPDTPQGAVTTSPDMPQGAVTTSPDMPQGAVTTSPDATSPDATSSDTSQATGTSSPDTPQVTSTSPEDTPQITGTSSEDTPQTTGITASSETTPADVKCKNVKYDCPNHSGTEVEFYCTNCNILLCSRCFINKHNGHEYIDLQSETAKDNATELVLTSEKLIQNKIESLEKTYATLLETSEKLKYFGEVACLRITKQTEKIIENIKITSEKTKTEIRSNVHQTETELTESREEIMEQIKNFKLDLDTNLPSLTEDSCVQILAAHPKIKELEELCESVKDNTPEVFKYMDWKDSDPSVDIAMLGSIVSKSYYKHKLNHFRFDINDINDKYFTYSRDKYISHDLVWGCAVKKFNKKYLSVFIKLKSDDNPTLNHCFVDYKISLLNNVNNYNTLTIKTSKEHLNNGMGSGWQDFISWAKLSDKNGGFLYSNDQFVVEVEITAVRKISYKSR